MKHYILLLSIIAMSGCSQTQFQSSESNEPIDSSDIEVSNSDSVEVPALEMPVIPATISEPEDMAGFIAIHFWDNLDFSDMEGVGDTVFLEQNFVDYLGVMPAVMASDRLVAFKALMKRSSANKAARELIVAFGEKYLNHPDSPMKNPEHYADFKQAAGGE